MEWKNILLDTLIGAISNPFLQENQPVHSHLFHNAQASTEAPHASSLRPIFLNNSDIGEFHVIKKH